MLSRLGYFLGDFWPYILFLVTIFFLSVIISFKILKSNLAKNRKNLSVSLLTFIFFTAIFFVVLEAYFRYVYDVPDGLGFLKVSNKWHERHVIHNSYFFRDRDFDPVKKEGINRVGVLGDSLAFGAGIENVENRFSNILEKKLNEAGHQAEVYNLGKPGYDTEAQIKNYDGIKELNFDIIVWEYFLNDIQPAEKSTGSEIITKNRQKSQALKWITDKSYFLDFLYWRFSSRYQNTFNELKDADINQYKNPHVLENHKKQIEDFIKKLKEENIEVVVVIFPFMNQIGPSYPAFDIHKDMSIFFSAQNIDVVDLLEDLKNKNPQELIASKFDAHPNEFVHQIAAERIFEKVKSLLN